MFIVQDPPNEPSSSGTQPLCQRHRVHASVMPPTGFNRAPLPFPSGGNPDDLTRLQARQQSEDLGHERKRVPELDARGLQHDDSDGGLLNVLLEGEVAIAREKGVKAIFNCQGKESAILNATPAHFLGGYGVMPSEGAT